MPTTQIVFNTESRKLIKAGIDKVANVVKVTLGAGGRNVVIGRKGKSHITKDGWSLAKSINLSDDVEAIGANIIKEVSKKTVDECGDNTTTSMVLAQAIVEQGFKRVEAGYNGMDLKAGIDKSVAKIIQTLKEMSTPVDIDSDLLNRVATISANNDENIGNIVADIVKQTGVDGAVKIENSETGKTYTKVVQGISFSNGMISPLLINDDKTQSCILEDAYILVCEGKISTLNDILPIFKKVVYGEPENKNNPKNSPLLIIAEDVEGEALSVMLTNRIKGSYPVCVVKAPSFGDNRKNMLKDIAIATGATVANDESGLRLDTLSLSHLGFASKIISTKDDTTIIGGKGEKHDVDAQITYIKKAIELAKHPYEKEQLEQRLAKLSGGVGIIYVGADSEAELLPLKDSFDDALRATKSALEEGVIVGGGIALLRCIEKLKYITPENEDERQGINLMSIVLQEPFKQMVKNSDVDISVTEILLMDTNFGYNFKTKRIENLFDSGVIDAKKVVRCALQNASSVAGTLLTTEAMIINIEPDNFVNPMLQQR